MTDFTAFDAAVEAQAGDVLAQLAVLCRIPSVSAERGPAMLDAAAFVQEVKKLIEAPATILAG